MTAKGKQGLKSGNNHAFSLLLFHPGYNLNNGKKEFQRQTLKSKNLRLKLGNTVVFIQQNVQLNVES